MFLPPAVFASVVRHAPLVSIDLIVRNHRGEILVGLRRNRPARGYWFVPGGRIGKNESIATAFARLTQAELGVRMRVEDAAFLGVFEHFYDDNFSTDASFGTHYVVLAHAINADAKRLALPPDQHDRFVWMSDAALLADDRVHPYTRQYVVCAESASTTR